MSNALFEWYSFELLHHYVVFGFVFVIAFESSFFSQFSWTELSLLFDTRVDYPHSSVERNNSKENGITAHMTSEFQWYNFEYVKKISVPLYQ